MGSILSRVDLRQVSKDDDILLAGVGTRSETRGAATTVTSTREGAIEASALSSSKKGAVEKVARRFSDTIALPSPNSTLTKVPSAPSKEKRKAQVLLKHLPPSSGSRSLNRRDDRITGNTDKSPPIGTMVNDSPSNPSHASAAGTTPKYSLFVDDKENVALQSANINAASSQSSKINCHHDEMPIPRKGKPNDQVKKPSKSPLTDGSQSCSTNSNCKSKTNAVTTLAESQRNASAKVPIDPPGAILGALPFVQYLNGQQRIVASTTESVPASTLGSHHSGGGINHPIFHPLFPSMTNWGYHPSHHQQSHLTQQHSGILNNENHNHSQQWIVPYLLAPFASAVCLPSSMHKTDELVPSNSWPSNDDASHPSNNTPTEPNASIENFVRNSATSTSDAEDTMSTDGSMASTEDDAHETEKVEPQFIPSTFAPPECVEKIRARQKVVAAKHNSVQPRQTRSMSRRQRRDSSRSSSSKNSSKSKPTSADAATAIAHQACSPRTNISQVNGSGSKVAAVNGIINGKNSPSPQVMIVLGKRVTMIDPVRKVFIIDLLSPEVCDEIRMMADDHTREIHKSGLNTETWRTLYTYTKMDLPVAEVKDMTKKYTEQILLDVKKIVGEIFGGSMRKEAMNLRPRSWKEPHLLLYQKLDDRPHHTGIEMHYDGCDITWQAMLTRIDEYEGGGTYFRSLRKTIKLQQGQVLVHPGELYHLGCDITYGVRCLLVCFTDGMNPKILDDSKSHEDHPSYRNNVFVY